MDAKEFTGHALTLAIRFRFSVTSWIRTPARNKAVGGQDNSTHLYGLGLDVILDNPVDAPQFTATANKIGISVLDEGDHLHLQPTKQKE